MACRSSESSSGNAKARKCGITHCPLMIRLRGDTSSDGTLVEEMFSVPSRADQKYKKKGVGGGKFGCSDDDSNCRRKK